MADQDFEDLLLDMAYRRMAEFNEEKSSISNNTSIILAIDGILLGFFTDRWFSSEKTLWLLYGISLLICSIVFCLYLLIGQKFDVLDAKKAWEGLAKQESIETVQQVKQEIILAVDKIEKKNTNKLQHLWIYYNGAIGSLISSVIMVYISLF